MLYLQELWLRLTYYYELVKLKIEIAIDKHDVDPDARLKASIFTACVAVLIGVIMLFALVGWARTVFLDAPVDDVDASLTQDSTESEDAETNELSTANTAPTTPSVISPEATASITEPGATALSANCDSNYTPCVPVSASDLDCGDIATSVQVIGVDVHRFDRDGDGIGCDSN